MPGSDIPNNTFGSQYARSGKAYCGFVIGSGGNGQGGAREVIQTTLKDTLKWNAKYCVQFFVSLADSSNFAIDKMGVHFSSNTINLFVSSTPPFTPFPHHVENTNGIISDTAGWVKIEGIHIGNGNETYMTISNLQWDNVTNSIQVNNYLSAYNMAYYYIDDVSVEEVFAANAGTNKTICYLGDSVQLGNNTTENAMYSWYPSAGLSSSTTPNPMAFPESSTTYYVTKTQCKVTSTDSVVVTVTKHCTTGMFNVSTLLGEGDYFFIHGLQENTSVEIYIALGEIVATEKNYSNNISANTLSNGTYYYKIILPDREIRIGKFIVAH